MHDASKVRASGPGLNTSGVPASLPVEFTIDARDAGEGLLTVQIIVSHNPSQDLKREIGITRHSVTSGVSETSLSLDLDYRMQKVLGLIVTSS